MNMLSFDNSPLLQALIYATQSSEDNIPVSVDSAGRPLLQINGTQDIQADALDIRNLSAATDTSTITGADFDVRPLNGAQDSVLLSRNGFFVASATQTLVIGGTTVLTVDTAPYARSAFLVRADSISLLTAASLQLAPINNASYYVTDSTQSGLILGGDYLFVPSVSIRYMRIFATGVGSQLTAYYVGQI